MSFSVELRAVLMTISISGLFLTAGAVFETAPIKYNMSKLFIMLATVGFTASSLYLVLGREGQ